MRKTLALIGSVLLTLSLSYKASASIIPIEVRKGVSVSFEKYLEPSELADPITVTGNFGFNRHLLLKCAYVTEEQRNILGGRYAFNEKMAVSFEHQWDDHTSSNRYGFAYKFTLSDRLDLAGLIEYQSKDIALTGQAEYEFTEVITAYGGVEYTKPEQGDAAIDLLIGAEYRPLNIFSLYFDYLMPEEGDKMVYFGLTYTF